MRKLLTSFKYIQICNFYKCTHYAFGMSLATNCHTIKIPKYILTNNIRLEKAIFIPRTKMQMQAIKYLT